VPKDLERDLGLYATITISIGAMVGSGIFVLPGLAAKIAGSAVILAYPLAGLIVLPAALSKAEMATAMPESGGTYLFIDRAMGPLPGTIAGLGAWFTLLFKSAFALVGLGAYLLLFAPLPTKPVAIGLGVVLLIVNLLGVKQTGRLQATIVSLVLLALVAFIGTGAINVDSVNYNPFFAHGGGGVLEAAEFVSYAGVTKIASVAEEVEDPGRNIPLSVLGSTGLMMAVYTLVVYVIVGVSPPGGLEDALTPMAVAASQFLGAPGRIGIAVIAVLAPVSMANAGVLSSSRYPLAMSRDALTPPAFSRISERFNTPVYSISFTGTIVLVLIAFVPVVSLAKLASAFQLLVFVFVNGADRLPRERARVVRSRIHRAGLSVGPAVRNGRWAPPAHADGAAPACRCGRDRRRRRDLVSPLRPSANRTRGSRTRRDPAYDRRVLARRRPYAVRRRRERRRAG